MHDTLFLVGLVVVVLLSFTTIDLFNRVLDLDFSSRKSTTNGQAFLVSGFSSVVQKDVRYRTYDLSSRLVEVKNQPNEDLTSSSSSRWRRRRRSSSTTSTTSSFPTSLFLFTGIVEEMGTVVAMKQSENPKTLWNDGKSSSSSSSSSEGGVGGYEVTIESDTGIVLDETAYIGCSICVSGVCLTVTSMDRTKRTFCVTLAPETLKRTYFGNTAQQQQQQFTIGSKVNLERAAPSIGGRNSGHTVQGHVDCTGTIVSKQYEGDSLVFVIQVDSTTSTSTTDTDDQTSIVPYIVPKGFIAIDGTSLTVIETNPTNATFSFMLIPFTQKHIILPFKNVGDPVNIEVDVLAKYASSILQFASPTQQQKQQQQQQQQPSLSAVDVPNTINESTIIHDLVQRIQNLEHKVQQLQYQLEKQSTPK